MSTTSDRLALLQRTKAGQRALLEGMYPDLDFSTIPFREYGRLFTGRKYVPGFVGGWKGYGRSNSEDPATREILPDYSGNGRDIRLYNFAFSGMSGYGGYALPPDKLIERTATKELTVTPFGIDVTLTAKEEVATVYCTYIRISDLVVDIPVRIKAGSNGARVYVEGPSPLPSNHILELSEGETGEFTISQADIDAGYSLVYVGPLVTMNFGESTTITFLPTYPGGLVSDGIDDYGQCIKGFSLPDDYTVVAIRKILNEKEVDSSFAAKSSGPGKGAFLLENGSSDTYSYGQGTSNLDPFPPLFIYQTKTSYCGKTITSGTGTDTEDDILCLFRKRVNESSGYYKCVLYDHRIYDHSLTAEELQVVKDDMMADYENATGGGIANIHYVADWDGKGRSNDEEEPMRSQWTDKATGKVIDLHNYAYAGMSGWGGYGIDISKVVVNGPQDLVEGNVLQVNAIANRANFLYGVEGMDSVSMKVRVEGISRAVASGKAYYLQIYFSSSGGERLQITGDGVHEVDLPVTEGSKWMYLYVAPAISAPDWTPIDPVTVEILPSYPGALVSDGIDDYGVTQETISEKVGTMLAMLEINEDEIKSGSYFFNCGKNENANRLYCWLPADGIPKMGLPSRNITLPIGVLTRTPASPSEVMYIASYSGGLPSKMALYRLILIQEQLDDAAVEFLKWKVDKEYRDWCRANGYEYAINQLTE